MEFVESVVLVAIIKTLLCMTAPAFMAIKAGEFAKKKKWDQTVEWGLGCLITSIYVCTMINH